MINNLLGKIKVRKNNLKKKITDSWLFKKVDGYKKETVDNLRYTIFEADDMLVPREQPGRFKFTIIDEKFIITCMIFARGSFIYLMFYQDQLPYLMIFITPLFAGLGHLMVGKQASAKEIISSWLSSGFVFACGVFILITDVDSDLQKQGGHIVTVKILEWIDIPQITALFTVHIDSTNQVMIFVVTSVSWLVQLYTNSYMKHDPALMRFKGFLLLFTFFMITLVTADNLLQIFFGWEGVGICSYLLINFWYNRIQANKAAIKAVLVNRVGDSALAIGIFLMFAKTGQINIKTALAILTELVSSAGEETEQLVSSEVQFIALFIFIGCMGKSAQLLLHTWLPDAMEGPTPVSALLHAATMVTAGVYLLIQLSPLFEVTHLISPLIILIGGITAFQSAVVALQQNDLKRVIAFSTCSQLGYMIMACGFYSFDIALFHLYNHAFFKALLFLTAGIIIHALSNEQDIRKMGGLINFLPFSYTMILIGSLALAGFPFLSGYYSKELILEAALAVRNNPAFFGYILGVAAAGLTSFYSTRSIVLIFFGKPNLDRSIMNKIHDAPKGLLISVSILAILSITSGYFGQDFFVGLGKITFSDSMSSITNKNHFKMVDAENLSYYSKMIPLISAVSGALLAGVYYTYLKPNGYSPSFYDRDIVNPRSTESFYDATRFSSRRWFFDTIYNDIIFNTFAKWYLLYTTIEKGLFERIFISGLSSQLRNKSNTLKDLQQGNPYTYLTSILFGTISSLLLLISFSLGIYMPFVIVLIIVSIRVHLSE